MPRRFYAMAVVCFGAALIALASFIFQLRGALHPLAVTDHASPGVLAIAAVNAGQAIIGLILALAFSIVATVLAITGAVISRRKLRS